MSWEHPIVLALIPPALVAMWWMFRRPGGAHDTAQYANIKRLWADHRGLADRPAATRRRWRGWFLALAVVAALLALARPQWGAIEETTYDQSREVLLALDLSRSMLADDVTPTRLARAKLLIESLLDQLRGERVGLVVFAGTAFVQSPLSADYEVLRDFLADLDPSYLPQGGTNYEAMLGAATKAFGQNGDGDRFLVVLSDGEAHDEGWKSFVPTLRDHGIRVIGLGVGTAKGALLPDENGGYLKDEHGAAVLSRLEAGTLQDLANETGGTYRDAASWVDIAALVNATVEQGRKGTYVEQKNIRLRDQFQWFLAPAVLFFLLSYWLEFPVFPVARVLQRRTRRVTPTSAPAPAVAAALFLLLLSQMSRSAVAATTAGQPPNATPPNALETTVSELAAKPTLAAADYARLATETISFASQSSPSAGPARLGVIDDALIAVDRGEPLDPKAADWPTLRKQLEQLKQAKKEPPPQNQQQQNQQQNQPQPGQGGSQQDQQQSQGGGQQQHDQQGQQGASADQKQNQGNDNSKDESQQPTGADQKEQQDTKSKDDSHAKAGKSTGADQNQQDKKEQQERPQQAQSAGGDPQEKREDGNQTQASNAGKSSKGEPQPPQAPQEVKHADTKPLTEAEAGLGDQKDKDEKKQPPSAAGAPEGESKPATRMVGGGRALPGVAPQGDLALAEALSKMEHVEDGDSPAVLFDRMNRAEGPRPPEQSGKNW